MSGFRARVSVSVSLLTQAVMGTLIAFVPAGAAQQASPPRMPDPVIREAVRFSNEESATHQGQRAFGMTVRMRRPVTEAEKAVARAAQGSGERRSKTGEVFDWLPSVGGERWFANYLEKFGAPRTPCVFRFQGGDLTSRELGHYYLRHPVRNGRPAAEPDCFAGLGSNYGIEDRYTKTMVAHIALAAWDAYLTTSESRYRERFLALADELLKSQEAGRWNWAIELPTRGVKAPWISGMTQSLGISVLLRAHALTGNASYLAGAGAALEWLRRPVVSGGVAMRAEKGVWYEEYPSIERPSHVLNGHIWALFGIWDYFRVTRDPEVAAMFRDGVAAVVNEIDRYDVGYWVVYDQLNRVDMINGYYLDFVVQQLRALHAITGEEGLARTADRWQRYLRDRSLFGHMAFEEHAKATMGPRQSGAR